MDRSLFKKAGALYQAGDPLDPWCSDYDDCLDVLAVLVENGGEIDEVYNLRWHIYYLRGMYAQAEDDLDKAMEINPLNRNVMYHRGMLFHKLKQFDRARVAFKSCLELARSQDDDGLIDAVEHYYSDL